MKRFFLLSIFLTGSLGVAQAPSAQCDDGTQIYKVCSDQNVIFSGSRTSAIAQGKLILITFGFSSCPWCQSMYRIVHSPEFTHAFSNDLIFLEIGTYSEGEKVPSGIQVLKDVLRNAEIQLSVVKGFPFLAVLNPRDNQLVYIDTGDLELNTATSKGHDKSKVFSVVRNSIGRLNELSKGK